MPAKQQPTAERGRSSNKAKIKKRGILSRSVSFRQQQTVVFHGGPREVLPSAVLLGDVDNDPRGDAEVAVGGVDGTLAVFKAAHTTPGPYLLSSGLGKLSTLALGPLLLGHSETQQLIACAGEGVCHIFSIRPLDVRWDSDSCCGRVQPLWSIPCPLNVTACCIADVNGDRRREVVVGTQDGVVHVLSFEVNTEEGDGDGDLASAKDARARQGTASSTPRPREDTSSGAYSPSIPLMEEGLALEHGGEWLDDVEDVCDHAARASREVSEPSTEVSELHWEDGKRTPSPSPPPNVPGASAAGPTEDTRAREWLENSPEKNPENTSTGTGRPGEAAPLNPHFKSLLQLPARSAVTSLAIVHYPETTFAPVVGNSVPTPDPAGMDAGNVVTDDIALLPGHSESEGGRSHIGSGETRSSSGGGLEASRRPDDYDSAEGVYVVVGLEAGGVEVMRLSSRRPGTRFFDLVDDPSENTADLDRRMEEYPYEDSRCGENQPRCGDECFEAQGSPAIAPSSVASIAAAASVANISVGEGDPAIETCPLRLEDAQDLRRPRESGPLEGNPGGRRGTPSALCDWRVPVEKTAAVPRALLEEQGWGMVVDLAGEAAVARTVVTAGNPGSVVVTPTGTLPLARTFLGGSGWGNFHAKDGAAGIVGGADSEEDEQAFAVCLSGRCVGCCRVVSTAEGLPRWRVVWTKQTEESLMAFQRLGCANRQENDRGKKETLLVACSFSGNTIIFGPDGTHCVEFNPGQFLKRPLTAFVAGDWTTSMGLTEPSLVYVSAGGEVVVYHGLVEKADSMTSAQFLPTLHENGSIDILRSLLENLAERLRWRSNQGDLLFPSPPPPSTESPDGVSVASGADPASATSNALSDDEREDSALSLPDAILARAVLCPVGIASATRGKDRRRSSGDGGAGGGVGGGSGAGGGVAGYVVDDERWRREARALVRGEGGTVTVGEGAAAAERVLREIRSWEDRGREPTLRNYPCLRETLAALTLWGSGPRRELLRNTLREAEEKAASP